jgi:predicted HTH transcriptional regulator
MKIFGNFFRVTHSQSQEREKNHKPVLIRYSETEKILLEYFEENELISISKFCKIAQITRKLAENILVDLISLNILELDITETTLYFKLKE